MSVPFVGLTRRGCAGAWARRGIQLWSVGQVVLRVYVGDGLSVSATLPLVWPCWRLRDGRFECLGCRARTSPTAGTIFDRTRTPLTVWFSACWLFSSGKDGISALSLKGTLEIGSYQTAWMMLHLFLTDHVEPGTRVITDAWRDFRGIDKLGYVHERRSQRAARNVHRGERAARRGPGPDATSRAGWWRRRCG